MISDNPDFIAHLRLHPGPLASELNASGAAHASAAPSPHLMTALERRASWSLAFIFALRMLGLFLVLPVFALEARHYPGGEDPAQIGLAMGIYGLTQALFQLPLGVASDRFGRKRVIVLGLLVFAAGSFVAMVAQSLDGLVLGRALQGAGAVSAAVTALLADQTREQVRTKAMAMVGGSIALMFALSLLLAPILAAWIGLAGLFAVVGILSLSGVVVVLWRVPAEPIPHVVSQRGPLLKVLTDRGLLRLNLGVFILHAVQLAMWVAIPAMLAQSGLESGKQWQIYLPAVLFSFAAMAATLFPLERRGQLRLVFLTSIAVIALVQIGLLLAASSTPRLGWLALLLFLFFCGFNVLEASQPSMVSRLAPAHARGAALGVYNTLQSLGFFAGGWLGGQLVARTGLQGLFAVCVFGTLIWLAFAWPMVVPKANA